MHGEMRNKKISDIIERLKEGQKIKIILKSGYEIEGTVKYTEHDQDYDDKLTVHICLENKGYGYYANEIDIENIIILNE